MIEQADPTLTAKRQELMDTLWRVQAVKADVPYDLSDEATRILVGVRIALDGFGDGIVAMFDSPAFRNWIDSMSTFLKLLPPSHSTLPTNRDRSRKYARSPVNVKGGR